jgi:hypothetical protein
MPCLEWFPRSSELMIMIPEVTRRSEQAVGQERARDVAVFFLLYPLRSGNTDSLFAAFLKSLRRYPAGMPYRPVVIQKGYVPGFIHPLILSWPTPDGCAPEIVEVPYKGFDLDAYRKAAQAIDAPMLLFFNSYSRVLAADWLSKLYSAAKSLGPGSVVGATGSWEALGEHTTFPNVAIRTNAFMIERDRLLSFAHPLDTKRDTNLFEAGPDNMTKNIMAAGGRVAIVDRDGRVIEPDDWPEAGVFRSGNQERLLVADNRTMDYQCVSLRRRTRRARLAFGDRAVIRSQNFIYRWWLAIAWRLGLM